jgi:hypothetical protein
MFFASFALFTMLFTAPVSAFVAWRSLAIQRPATAATLSLFPRAEFNTATTRRSMTSNSDEKTNAIDSPLDRPVLAALDFAAILLFALVGTASHAKDGIDLLAVVAVAVPFWISWFLVTPFLGLYSDKATIDTMGAFLKATKGWIVAVPLGCVLRGIIKGYVPPIPFIVVTMIATLVMIGGTRVVYTAVNEKPAS